MAGREILGLLREALGGTSGPASQDTSVTQNAFENDVLRGTGSHGYISRNELLDDDDNDLAARPTEAVEKGWNVDERDSDSALARLRKREPIMRDQGWFDESGRIRRTHPMDKWMSGEKDWVAVCAPMVRYSKLPFRQLVRDYNVDIAYTPMILSDVFKYSAVSRSVDFTTCFSDDPVVVQFAANNAIDLGDASELVAPFVNGVDLNCGCPQKWALHEKIGAHLLEHPDLVADMVSQTKSRTSGVLFPTSPSQRRSLNSKYGDQSFPVSVKIRIDVSGDLKKTVEFARRAEKVGADWVTVHGRTRKQKSTEPVDLVAIKLVKESLSIPVFANGDVFSRADADRIAEYTGTDGIMAARGLLENPALFAGDLHTPPEAIRKFVRLSLAFPQTTFFITHHHLMYMMEKLLTRAERRSFNALTSMPALLDWLEMHYCWTDWA